MILILWAHHAFIITSTKLGKKLIVLRNASLFCLFAGLILFTHQIWADTWQSAVGSKVSTEYATNPLLTPGYYGGVWRALLEPSYALSLVDGNNEIKTGLVYQIEKSSNQTLSQDRQSPTVFIDWLRKNESGDLDLSAKYTQIATRESGVDATTGSALLGGTRTSKLFSGTWNYSLSENGLLNILESEEFVSFGGGSAATSFVDYSAQTSSLKYSYKSSERSTPFVKVAEERYSPSSVGQSVSLTSVLLGLELKGEYVDWTFQAGESQSSDSTSNYMGSIEALYKVQYNAVDASVGYYVTPSGLGGFAYVDEKKLSWHHDFSDYSALIVDFDNRVTSQLASGNGTFSSSTVSIEHQISTILKVRAYYGYRASQTEGAGVAISNTLGMSLDYSNPNF